LTRVTPMTLTAAATRATKRSAGEEARLLESRQVLPGQLLQRWEAAAIARRVRPGQYVHVLSPRAAGLLLPAVPVAGFDRARGTIDLLPVAATPPHQRLGNLRVGDNARLDGPLGRGFEIDARNRYLLVVADGPGLARVRATVDEAVATGRQVTVLLGAHSVADVPPSSLLPDEAEYIVATEDGSLGHHGAVTELVPDYEAWADQCFSAGSDALLQRMATLAKGRDGRLGVARLGRRRGRRPSHGGADARRKSWLQVALPYEAGCALGVCLGCVVTGADGPLRACREGPAFAAGELRWEPPR
jgi:dihydroorotate dehydrogenase electron transfer subunit